MALQKAIAFLSISIGMHQTIKRGEGFFCQAFHHKAMWQHYEPAWSQMCILWQSKSAFLLYTKNYGICPAGAPVMTIRCMNL